MSLLLRLLPVHTAQGNQARDQTRALDDAYTVIGKADLVSKVL